LRDKLHKESAKYRSYEPDFWLLTALFCSCFVRFDEELLPLFFLGLTVQNLLRSKPAKKSQAVKLKRFTVKKGGAK
jgi:hypothetical protein